MIDISVSLSILCANFVYAFMNEHTGVFLGSNARGVQFGDESILV